MFGTSRMRRLAATTLATAAIGIAGFHQGARAEASSAVTARLVTVRVVLRDFTVSMTSHRLPAGTPIRFVITNRGEAMHETILERAGAVDRALKFRSTEYEADDIAPGTTRVVTWTIPHAGTYQLACHMPGHYQMGMKTLFTVRGR